MASSCTWTMPGAGSEPPGQGVNRQLVHLGSAGQGVNRQLVHLGDAGRGVNRKRVPRRSIEQYMQALADRLRNVRVCTGDWRRIVTDGALAYGDSVGVFLDPPYSLELRGACYNTDDGSRDIPREVYQWAKEHENDPRLRIALCGYEGEYDLAGWQMYGWTANRSYGRADSHTANCENRTKETIWFSPSCSGNQLNLFPGVGLSRAWSEEEGK